jgi:hypothetical protein
MDLVDYAIQVDPGKPVSIISRQSLVGENFHGARVAPAHEPENWTEEQERHESPDDPFDFEAVLQLEKASQRHQPEEKPEQDKADEGDLAGPNLEPIHGCDRVGKIPRWRDKLWHRGDRADYFRVFLLVRLIYFELWQGRRDYGIETWLWRECGHRQKPLSPIRFGSGRFQCEHHHFIRIRSLADLTDFYVL